MDLLSSANEEVLVCSPYIDELIVPLLNLVKEGTTIKILTEDVRSPLFKRLVTANPKFAVKFVKESTEGVQLYQVHAKFVCVDRKSAIVMSANINERSLYYNIEIGLLVSDDAIAGGLSAIFEEVYSVAKELN